MLPTPATDARFSPDGTLVATSSRDGSVRIWRVRDGALVRTLGRGPPLAVVRFSPDGSLVAAVARNGTVRLWRVADGGGQPVLHAPPRVRAVEVAPDGDTLATASTQGAELWSVDGRLLHVLRRHGPRSTVADLVFSPDGKRLLTTSTDTDGRIWSVATDRPLVLLRGQYGVARRRERSARRPLGRDGRRDERRHLARPDGPAPLLRGHERQLTAVSFSPSGGQLLTASADGTVRTYDCRLCSGLAGLERLAEAGLSRSGIAR